ncbi:hypothetical protein D3C74_372260 [compost metagenome]
MKSQSAQAAPAIPLKKFANGPWTPPRKPAVGLPPLIQARSEGVENPSPKVLSRKAHTK